MDANAVNHATQGIEALVHLAVTVSDGDYATPQRPFNTNVMGTNNVFEAARLNQVRKIVLMSSAPVHLTFVPDEIVDAAAPLRTSPDGDHLYDSTKRLQEDIARDYCATYDLNAVTLRAGHSQEASSKVDGLFILVVLYFQQFCLRTSHTLLQ